MDSAIKEFLSEASESIDILDRSLVAFERTPNDTELLSDIFRLMHSMKGTCGFLGLHRLAKVAHAAENVLDRFRGGDLTPNPNSVSAILSSIDRVKLLLSDLAATGQEAAGDDSALIRELNAIANAAPIAAEQSSAGPDLLTRIGGVSVIDCAAEIAYGRLRAHDILKAQLETVQEDLVLGAVRDAVCAALDSAYLGAPLSTALQELGLNPIEFGAPLLTELRAGLVDLDIAPNDIALLLSTVTDRDAVAASPSKEAASPEPAQLAPAMANQSIRVQVESLEQLMNVASELVLIRNQLLQVLRDQPDSPFGAPLQRLNVVTSELQESVMTTRMQPIGAAWAKLPRLARDLALELGKKIDLHMDGGETELDRQVLEQIKDPLTHMLRNAADHGLEMPQERLAAGKSETGVISLKARHEGSHIVIEVADDGRGLQPAKIRAKAIAQGLITETEAESLSDAKIQSFIFHAGFSTAASISGISGRGVGMDVVRTNIEKIGGAVELSSSENRGTRFIIRIPLTLTIISALIIESCGQRFAMPQSSVLELVGIHDGAERQIEQINGAPVLRLRERLLPLVSLQSLMQLESAETCTDHCVVVMQVGSFTCGIVVDRVFDTEEIVVKPVAKLLRSIPFYAGATILGDGAVIMILNPKSIAAKVGDLNANADNDSAIETSRKSTNIAQMLVVSAGAHSVMATPLTLVSRIEELDTSSVEYTEGRPVVQYRDRIMPVIVLDGAEPIVGGAPVRPMIVFDDGYRSMGLMADAIIDIVEAPLSTSAYSQRDGVLGNTIILGRVTDLIDISYYWRSAMIESALLNDKCQTSKRVLLIEPSAFQAHLMKPLLQLAGYEVETATTLADALLHIDGANEFVAILADVSVNADRPETMSATPIIGLYSNRSALSPQDRTAFASVADRFDRDSILNALRDVATVQRSAA